MSRAGRGRVADDRDSARGTRYEAATSSRFATAGSRRSVRTARLNSRPLEADGSVAAGQAPADGSVTHCPNRSSSSCGWDWGPFRRPREPGPRRHPSGHAGEFTNSLGSSIRWPSCCCSTGLDAGGFSALARFCPREADGARRRGLRSPRTACQPTARNRSLELGGRDSGPTPPPAGAQPAAPPVRSHWSSSRIVSARRSARRSAAAAHNVWCGAAFSSRGSSSRMVSANRPRAHLRLLSSSSTTGGRRRLRRRGWSGGRSV